MKTINIVPSLSNVHWCNEYNTTCLVHGFSALNSRMVFVEFLRDTMEPLEVFNICDATELTFLGTAAELSEIFVFKV